MNRTIDAIEKKKQLRVIGFDDAPFSKQRGSPVNITGIVCSNTRFEGMLWSEISKDGSNATAKLIEAITNSKFHSQLHAVLLDGIAFGGFNIIDLPLLVNAIAVPCITVMRKVPNIDAIDLALENFEDSLRRKNLIKLAGPIYEQRGFVFQVLGIAPDYAAQLLDKVTDTGKVPESLRLAHLIGAAIKTGESSNRA